MKQQNINPMTETAYFSHAAMHAGNSQNLNISTTSNSCSDNCV